VYLGEIPVISGGPFMDMTAPSVGNNFGLGIDVSCGTIDGARGGTGLERFVPLEVFPEDESLLFGETPGLDSCLSCSKLLE
jgi:hypothetical protein